MASVPSLDPEAFEVAVQVQPWSEGLGTQAGTLVEILVETWAGTQVGTKVGTFH